MLWLSGALLLPSLLIPPPFYTRTVPRTQYFITPIHARATPRTQYFITMIEDDEPVSAVGKELRIDADKTGVGVTALIGAAALVPLLAFGVATTLGMGIGSIDNDGMGTPLSREEVRALTSRSGADASSSEDDRPRTYEEAAEEQALVDILQGGIRRAR